MKSKSFLFLVMFVFFPVSALFGENISLDEILLKMDEADKKIQTVSFDFNQYVVYTLTGEKQSNFGSVVFQKSNNLYLKQYKPIEQVIISNGKKVWVYTPSYAQVLVDDWKRWANNSMIPASMTNFGQNLGDLKKKYNFSYAGADNNGFMLLLVPIKKELWKLKLWIDKETFVPKRASLMGENIVINTELTNYVLNPKVDKSIFVFQPKNGVEILNIP